VAVVKSTVGGGQIGQIAAEKTCDVRNHLGLWQCACECLYVKGGLMTVAFILDYHTTKLGRYPGVMILIAGAGCP